MEIKRLTFDYDIPDELLNKEDADICTAFNYERIYNRIYAMIDNRKLIGGVNMYIDRINKKVMCTAYYEA